MYNVLFIKLSPIYFSFHKSVIKQSNVKERDPTSNYDPSMYTDDDPLYAECSKDLMYSSYSQKYSQEYSQEYNQEYSHEPLYSTVNKKKKKSGMFTYSIQLYSPNKKAYFDRKFSTKNQTNESVLFLKYEEIAFI